MNSEPIDEVNLEPVNPLNRWTQRMRPISLPHPMTRTVRIEVPPRTTSRRRSPRRTRRRDRSAAAHRRGARRIGAVPDVGFAPVDSRRGRPAPPRFGSAAVARRRRERDSRDCAGERPRIDRPRRSDGMDRRVRRRRPHPLHDLRRSSRSRRAAADDRDARGHRGTTRPGARSAGAGHRAAGPRARRRPARQRQVDADLRARRSRQSPARRIT